jgi:hypothetical protein
MKTSPNDQFRYLPVTSVHEPKILEHSRSCMLNAVRPVPSEYYEGLSKLEFLGCDSGGLQLYRAQEAGKSVIVGPLMKTKVDYPDVITLGIFAQCREYGRINADMALMIDYPVNPQDSDLDYYWKLSESRKVRDHMLKAAPYLCPNTELAIAIQSRFPREAPKYLSSIYTPEVATYAYPVRYRNKPENAIGNAYVLSLLHDVGIRRVHFLGSSAPVVIFVLAQALALGMFERITFDSFTWKQRRHAGFRYFDPYTLTAKDVHQCGDLQMELTKYPGLFERTLGRFSLGEYVVTEKWVDLYNIRAIEVFKDLVVSEALTNGLDTFVIEFDKYDDEKDEILTALRLLRDIKSHGHQYVERNYSTLL